MLAHRNKNPYNPRKRSHHSNEYDTLAMIIKRKFTIPPSYFGMRLDQALTELLPEYSRSRIQHWLTHGQITVNGNMEKPKTKVIGEESVEVHATLEQEQHWAPEAIELDIIHEDAAMMVINKPAGMVAHPAAGNLHGTLVNALLHHCPELESLPRAGLIHRLDKDTTGLLVIAKTLEAHTQLVKQMQSREIKREYIAIVNGQAPGSGTVDAPIGRHPVHRQKMAINPLGKPAVTHYHALDYFRAHTLLKVILETGRTHQIRVHMASLGHPVTGDQLYGQLRLPARCPEALQLALRAFLRQALHARKLTLLHPLSGKEYTWQAPTPDDMQRLIDLLRNDNDTADSLPDDEFDEDDFYDE